MSFHKVKYFYSEYFITETERTLGQLREEERKREKRKKEREGINNEKKKRPSECSMYYIHIVFINVDRVQG